LWYHKKSQRHDSRLQQKGLRDYLYLSSCFRKISY
jgi:hypothetical protein